MHSISRSSCWPLAFLCGTGLIGCSSEAVGPVSDLDTAAPSPAAAGAALAGLAPRMPAGWAIVRDDEIVGDELLRIETQIGAKLNTLRNTVYRVNGYRVQVNTMTVPTLTAAETATTFLGSLKPPDFVLCKGLTVYEFVCADEAIPDAHAGRKHLAER